MRNTPTWMRQHGSKRWMLVRGFWDGEVHSDYGFTWYRRLGDEKAGHTAFTLTRAERAHVRKNIASLPPPPWAAET